MVARNQSGWNYARDVQSSLALSRGSRPNKKRSGMRAGASERNAGHAFRKHSAGRRLRRQATGLCAVCNLRTICYGGGPSYVADLERAGLDPEKYVKG